VLHVTEAMAGGILTFVSSIARRQADEGARVSVLYARRPESLPDDEIASRLGSAVRVLQSVDNGSSARNGLELLKKLRRISSEDYDVVHLHSSIAGAVGRMRLSKCAPLTVYSPHGFAFLRLDRTPASRWLARTVERALSTRAYLMLTSESELQLARKVVGAANAELVQSGVPSSSIPTQLRPTGRPRPRVITVARMVYQKAPWRFAAVARELSGLADFTWVGGGSNERRAQWIGDAPVTVLDWLSPEELDTLLLDSDVFLFPTLWEGMSLALAQAQSRGLPAVTTNVVGNRDAVVDGETGFVCDTDDELIVATRRILSDPILREQMSAAATKFAQRALVDDNLGNDTLIQYETWIRAAGSS